ncbi:hypothetical protein GCM10022419_073650 [Nonomuraea rosea]|uniref:histidine kinase n=1 Tax=Nonomuraea rosea TaxID=638574 RepID=A0ABP6YEJ5_9ACTN
MRGRRGRRDNVPVETGERRPWWRHVLDLYRRLNEDYPDQRYVRDTPGQRDLRDTPERRDARDTPGQRGLRDTPERRDARDTPARRGDGPDRLSRRALAADVVIAIVLTVIAVTVSANDPATGPTVRQPDAIEYLRLRPDPPAGHAPLPSVLSNDLPPRSGDPLARLPSHEAPAFLVALTALPLAVRRRYPLIAFWVVLVAARATHEDATWITVLTCAVAAYGAAAHSRHRILAMGGLVFAAGLAGAGFGDIAPALPGWMGPFVVLLSVGVLGSFVRFWRRQLGASRRRLAELQQAQEDAMRRAVTEERSRIAAELHDVVTHNVNVMVIQAGAARSVMDAEPEQSKQALLAIESGGRAAMAELRHVMGLLAGPGGERFDGPSDGLEPQPGLDQLDGLVERVRAAGVPVRVAVSPPGPLPPGIDLAVYRVVQEALTNTIKHAPGAAASVTIGHDGDWLEIEVTDTGGTRAAGPRTGGSRGPIGPQTSDGRGRGRPRTDDGKGLVGPRANDDRGLIGLQTGDDRGLIGLQTGGGRGLIGLRERLAVYGGTLDAGQTAEGGFRIKARVPWRTA